MREVEREGREGREEAVGRGRMAVMVVQGTIGSMEEMAVTEEMEVDQVEEELVGTAATLAQSRSTPMTPPC